MKIFKSLFRFILLVILVVLLFVSAVIFFLYRDYKKWEVSFENSHLSSDFISLPNEVLQNSLDEKIKKFGESTKEVDFMELKDTEVMYLVGESLNESLPLNTKFERGYIRSERGNWDMYIKLKISERYTTPWILVKLKKDNIESPEVYASTICIGNYDFNDYGLRGVVKMVNKGITEAITLVNSSDFTGRTFRNMELEQGILIIKGEK